MISASFANSVTVDKINAIVSEQLTMCAEAIKDKLDNTTSFCAQVYNLHDNTISALNELGYVVTDGADGWFEISWYSAKD